MRLLRSACARAVPARLVAPQLRQFRTTRVVCMAKDAMPAEAAELVKAGARKYLDVRTKEEFVAGHAPGAVNVPVVFLGAGGMSPNPNFLTEAQKAFPDKSEALVVGCKSGRRSLMAIDILSQAGYTDTVNVTGGFDLWAGSGLPIEK